MTVKYKCHATIEGGKDGTLRTSAYRECFSLKECEKFYLELGHKFYTNDEIKHCGNDAEGHSYYLDVDDEKNMINYVRAMAKNADANLEDKTDKQIVLYALSYLGLNIYDAKIFSGIEGIGSDA